MGISLATSKTPHSKILDSKFPTWPIRLVAGRQVFNLKTRVRFSYGLLFNGNSVDPVRILIPTSIFRFPI